MLQFETWSSRLQLEDLLDYTEGCVTEMANAVFNDWPTIWVAPHLRAGAPRHLALPPARTAAIQSALIALREWHELLSGVAEFAMPPVGYAQLGNPPPPLELSLIHI